jgi:hypothetical protein
MAFRADESKLQGYEEVMAYLVPRKLDVDKASREASKEFIEDVIDELGPVIDTYPTWHPLVSNHNSQEPEVIPNQQCGYIGLDHTRYFQNGFISCPYTASGKAEKIIESVQALPPHPVARITAQRLDVQLYHSETSPILVKCEWAKSLNADGTIPLSIAIPLILEQEVPCWRWSQYAETWETMRYYLLGCPHGARSSLFVNQETGQGIKKIWNALIYTGMFGSIKIR